MLGLWLSRYVAPLLTFGLTIPLWLVAAIALWVHLDKASAVRVAVDKAVTELVAGAELEAAHATAEAERKLRHFAQGQAQEARRRVRVLEDANTAFAAALAAAEAEKEDIRDAIDDLLSRPVDGACAVDADLLGRLRNR